MLTGPPNWGLVEGLFDVQNNGAMRVEIEIALEKLNELPFRGTINPVEAKHAIYGQCLGCENFDNFEGVRFGYKGEPVIIFILKSAINVDELLTIQYFEHSRKSTRQGITHADVISCKIRGLRAHSDQFRKNDKIPRISPAQDDGSRLVTIEGCE